LANVIKAAIPDAQVTGFVGRNTSCEVKVNGEEIHSKLKTMGFPDFEEVVQICNETVKGSPPTQVQKVDKPNLNILAAGFFLACSLMLARYFGYF
jgi:selenoprotein W-related protein